MSKQPTYIKEGWVDERGLYERGYYFDSEMFPPELLASGVWRRDPLRQRGHWEPDTLISFERKPYAGWQATGDAFEKWPTRRGNRRKIAGQTGGFLSSYHPRLGDAAMGTLRSAPFLLVGDNLVMRVAGGRDPERLRVSLFVDGARRFSATGHNSYTFARRSWDIHAFKGRSAELLVEDTAQNLGGHIMLDEIQQWSNVGPLTSN